MNSKIKKNKIRFFLETTTIFVGKQSSIYAEVVKLIDRAVDMEQKAICRVFPFAIAVNLSEATIEGA